MCLSTRCHLHCAKEKHLPPGITTISGVTRSTHKTQCVHALPWPFVLCGVGWKSPPPAPPPPTPNTHTKQNVHTHRQNLGYASDHANHI